MIAALALMIAQIFESLATGALELCLLILIAAIKPWRYLLSRSYRTKINAEFAQRHPFLKWWNLLWGTMALSASVAIISAATLFITSSSTTRTAKAGEHHRIFHEIAHKIVRRVMEHRSADQ
jgi:hypothetical protein